MKIPGNDGNAKKPGLIGNDPAEVANMAKGVKRGLTGLPEKSNDPQGVARGHDSVTVSGLAGLLSRDFSPEAMQAERRAKVEQLKELVQSGKYKPESEKVAKSLSEELSIEILLAGDEAAKDDDLL